MAKKLVLNHVRGPKLSHIWNPRPYIALFTVLGLNGAIMTIKGSLYTCEHPHCFQSKILSTQNRPKNVFLRKWGVNINFYFQNPKGTSLHGTASFDEFVWGLRLYAK